MPFIGAEMQSAGAFIRLMNIVPAAIFMIWRHRFAMGAFSWRLFR